jgi:hypothetical protein
MNMKALPEVDVGPAIEPLEPWVAAVKCEPTAQSGVIAFKDFVLEQLGGANAGIARGCEHHKVGPDGQIHWSVHHEGRGWDWHVMANEPDDVARVDALIEWLTKTDKYGNEYANWRRTGLNNLIWDRRSFRPQKGWRPYTGSSPHSDHVHFAFSWPGARGETSFYQWLAGGAPLPGPAPPRSWVLPGLAVGGGLVIGYLGWRWAMTRVA